MKLKKYKLEGKLKICVNFDDLNGLETNNFIIEASNENGNGWVNCKEVKENLEGDTYLSTHTFYENCYLEYQKTLRRLGFNIKLKSWG